MRMLVDVQCDVEGCPRVEKATIVGQRNPWIPHAPLELKLEAPPEGWTLIDSGTCICEIHLASMRAGGVFHRSSSGACRVIEYTPRPTPKEREP